MCSQIRIEFHQKAGCLAAWVVVGSSPYTVLNFLKLYLYLIEFGLIRYVRLVVKPKARVLSTLASARCLRLRAACSGLLGLVLELRVDALPLHRGFAAVAECGTMRHGCLDHGSFKRRLLVFQRRFSRVEGVVVRHLRWVQLLLYLLDNHVYENAGRGTSVENRIRANLRRSSRRAERSWCSIGMAARRTAPFAKTFEAGSG